MLAPLVILAPLVLDPPVLSLLVLIPLVSSPLVLTPLVLTPLMFFAPLSYLAQRISSTKENQLDDIARNTRLLKPVESRE